VLQLQADGLLHRGVLEDARRGVVLPDLVVEPGQNAGQGLCEERPHLAQRRPQRRVNIEQIEADGVPVGGHWRLQRERCGGQP
jgi:hypothetical protein